MFVNAHKKWIGCCLADDWFRPECRFLHNKELRAGAGAGSMEVELLGRQGHRREERHCLMEKRDRKEMGQSREVGGENHTESQSA